MPSMFGPEFDEALQEAATPTRADVMTARSVAGELLAEGRTPTAAEVLRAWLRRNGTDPDGPTQLTATVRNGNVFNPPSRDDPALLRIRGEAAVAEAFARLIADGLIVRIHTDGAQPAMHRGISVVYPGGAQSADYTLNFPVIADDPQARWRLIDDHAPANVEVLSADDLCEGLEPLLGVRGMRALNEAHAALRRRLWLAAAGMLATASEAAWFSLARKIATAGTELDRLASAGENSARVHQLAAQRLREIRVPAAVVNDLAAQGANFRDIRNYALHPGGGGHDADREVGMTEAGCTALFMSARRYFVKMLDASGT
jgi:hypothetical protein